MTKIKKIIPVGKWQKVKPDFPCVFATANMWGGEFEYAVWSIRWAEGEDDTCLYLELLEGDGDEWGDLDDLTADYYLIIPELKP